MKRWFGSFILVLSLGAMGVWAQQPVDLVKQQAEINSLKADLEEARRNRDQVVAARWQARKQQNDEREALTGKYGEAKERVEVLMTERTRLFDEVRAAREELEMAKATVEKARAEFMAMAAQQDRTEGLGNMLDQGIPFQIPERLQRLNEVKKTTELYRDDPARIARAVLGLAVSELEFTRQVVWEDADLVFGEASVRGQRLRLGGLGAVQFDPISQNSALLLPMAGEKGRLFAWQANLSPEVKAQIGKVFFESKDSMRVMVPADVLLSTSLSSEMANRKEVGWKDQVRQFMREGGILMWPIVGLFVLALLFSLERFVVVLVKGRCSRKKLAKVLTLCEQGDREAARELALQLKGSVGKVAQAVLRRPHGSRAAAEKAVEEVFASETPALERRLTTISVFGASAPLLGLLGTVMGMIQLFEVITLYGTSDPKLLAGGISVALITTEGGLMAAIPVQLIHNWISGRVDALIANMEITALRLLNALWIDG
jgi:biopolymer transport protein ExbB